MSAWTSAPRRALSVPETPRGIRRGSRKVDKVKAPAFQSRSGTARRLFGVLLITAQPFIGQTSRPLDLPKRNVRAKTKEFHAEPFEHPKTGRLRHSSIDQPEVATSSPGIFLCTLARRTQPHAIEFRQFGPLMPRSVVRRCSRIRFSILRH